MAPGRGDTSRVPRDTTGRFPSGRSPYLARSFPGRADGRNDLRVIVDVSGRGGASTRGRGGREGRAFNGSENSRWVLEKTVTNPSPPRHDGPPRHALFYRSLPQEDLPATVVDDLFAYIRGGDVAK